MEYDFLYGSINNNFYIYNIGIFNLKNSFHIFIYLKNNNCKFNNFN